MKKNLFAFLGLVLLSMPLAATADQFGDFFYSSDGTKITITNYTGTGGAVVIPDTIAGLPVTSIGNAAFIDCTNLTSVTIPISVTAIGDNAFRNCGLANVTIPASVTNIGDLAFWSDSLTVITVDSANPSYSSADGVLFNKSQTTLIQYPGGKIGSYTIPASVTTIGNKAFYWCAGLTSVTIPGSVTTIEDNAFDGCWNLTSVTIPASVTTIGHSPFFWCGLMSITVDAANPSYSSANGVLFNKNQTTLIQYPGGKIGSYTIPASVTTIGGWAFYGSWQLTSVTIPGSVTNIGDGAFGVCTSLIGLYFTGNAPSIGSDIFSGTDNTTVYYLPGTTGWGETFAGRPTAPWIIIGPVIQANGSTNDISINSGSTLSISVRLYPGDYAGVPVDWWIVAQAGSAWYYLNDSMQWTSFDGNLSNCHPMYMGGLINLPMTEVLYITGLPAGSYTFWFAVDYPMDGVLDVNGTILVDTVNVTVQ